MAYPSSVISFSVKVDNDVIEPAHVNLMQTEIEAIEAGLLNSLAHDLKLAATKKLYLDGGTNAYLVESADDVIDVYTNAVKALSISALQQISSPTQFRCRVFEAGSVNIATGGAVVLFPGTDDFDVGAMHNPASNSSRITIPTGGDGLYLIGGGGKHASTGAGQRYIYLQKNGVFIDGAADGSSDTAAAAAVSANASVVLNLVATDYIELFAFQDTGGNLGFSLKSLFAVRLW